MSPDEWIVLGVVLGALVLFISEKLSICLLYTSDAADERSSVDLGGRRIIKKKKSRALVYPRVLNKNTRQTLYKCM